MTIIPYVALLIMGTVLLTIWSRWRLVKRADFIRSYMFPPGLLDKLLVLRPELSLKDRQLVARALRQFFLAYHKSGYKHVAMPSQVVDDLWHEFILYTKNYQSFCRQAFGRYMHHIPAAVLGKNKQNNDAIRRIWHFACLEENINPQRATRLPLLFALDAKWNIANGFRYEANCRAQRKTADGVVYCGTDFSSSLSAARDYSASSDNGLDGDNIAPYSFSSDFGSGSSSDSSYSSYSSDSSSDSSGSSGCSGGCSSSSSSSD